MSTFRPPYLVHVLMSPFTFIPSTPTPPHTSNSPNKSTFSFEQAKWFGAVTTTTPTTTPPEVAEVKQRPLSLADSGSAIGLTRPSTVNRFGLYHFQQQQTTRQYDNSGYVQPHRHLGDHTEARVSGATPASSNRSHATLSGYLKAVPCHGSIKNAASIQTQPHR